MSLESKYEFLVILITAILVLELLAKLLRLPPAVALIAGGMALALVPGVPEIDIDPDFVMVVFLPPLLMSSAYFTVWREIRRHFWAIASLALGAVAFTTLGVGFVFHLLLPQFPLAVGFALGAIVSPPDAVAAGAILERLNLPNPITAVLDGESLFNDASGLVFLRFAVAAALTGSFSASQAVASFAWLALGGVLVGLAGGWLGLLVIRKLRDSELIITATLLLAAVSYISAESAGVSGVLATVTTGLLLGWHQHEAFAASTRVQSQAFWKTLVFLMESLLFILIGLSLRGVSERISGLPEYIIPIAGVVLTVVFARFVYLGGSNLFVAVVRRNGRMPKAKQSLAATIVMGWAGMRGVVTLAAALSLPVGFPGRDIVLVAAFAVIIFTVLVQGITLAPLIRLLKIANPQDDILIQEHDASAWKQVAEAQYRAVQILSRRPDGSEQHPRLVEQYEHRARAAAQYLEDRGTHELIKADHFDAVLAAIRAGRAEVIRMYRSGEIRDRVMRDLEHELDLQEIAAENRK
ncbi:Na+/H+ antiporter (plasmid) [Rhizobium sp. T1470]|uniref:Na+/H+ antiporter n=1 Tax=unclassified Rhizobium TaxID=2613769 RepID=UPI001AAEE7CF|nr:Na+/H+ antiporter [Rhizobium sp. T1473]MCA0805569.1 Na+/H+ antiporter [Rhizobium sp. T1473]